MTYTPAEKREVAQGMMEALIYLKTPGATLHENGGPEMERTISILQAIAADYAERDLLDGGAG